MQGGKLDQRVTIERRVAVVDDWGSHGYTWEPVATVWAAVEPLNGREFMSAQMAQAEIESRIRVRYRPGLSVADRIVHEGMLHSIVTVINPRSGDRELVLMCKASAS